MRLTEFNEPTPIIELFDALNDSNVNYLLLRNINNELPYGLKKGKDIDIAVPDDSYPKFLGTIKALEFKEVRHPHRGDNYLYGARKFKFFKNKTGVLIDCHFALLCRSLDKGQWIPVHENIQQSAFKNKTFRSETEFKYWGPCNEDELLMLITRSIFDKRCFEVGYRTRIDSLVKMVDHQIMRTKLKLVFFNFADLLYSAIQNQEYESLIKRYIGFKEY
jgi:hypothetical protein